MFIAHAPAGYLMARYAFPDSLKRTRGLWITALFFSVAPDLDLFWFYTFGKRAVAHHAYVTHWPLFWVLLAAAGLALSCLRRKSGWRPYIAVALAGALLHCALDSVAAEIYWLAPFSMRSVNLIHIPAAYDWWVWNFILHWTFALELGICIAAFVTWLKGRRKNSLTVSRPV